MARNSMVTYLIDETIKKSGSDLTSAISDVGNGNMQQGLIHLWKDGENSGLSKGVISTSIVVGICILIQKAIHKFHIKQAVEQLAKEPMPDSISPEPVYKVRADGRIEPIRPSDWSSDCKEQEELNMTREQLEARILKKLKDGLFDGSVGGDFPAAAATYCRRIIDGIPQHISIYPDGTKTVDKKYETELEKLEFIRSAGWMMADSDANMYSRLYKREGR